MRPSRKATKSLPFKSGLHFSKSSANRAPFYKLTLMKAAVTIPPMRKGYIWILAIVALLGMANCVLVEPAFACDEDAAACSMPDCQCCLTCNSASHQWATPQSAHSISIHCLSHSISIPSLAIPVDPPLGSIFHPPTPF